jgi:hypothetical protein
MSSYALVFIYCISACRNKLCFLAVFSHENARLLTIRNTRTLEIECQQPGEKRCRERIKEKKNGIS